MNMHAYPDSHIRGDLIGNQIVTPIPISVLHDLFSRDEIDEYDPRSIIEILGLSGIKVNENVMWSEFVLDDAQLAELIKGLEDTPCL